MEGQAATNRSLDTLEEALTNTDQQLETLRATTNSSLNTLNEIQINASQHLETKITEVQAATNRSLDILEEAQTNAGEQLEALTEGLAAVNSSLDTLQNSVTNAGKQVAFSVYQLKSTVVGNYGVTFQRTLMNTGSFDLTTGKFTCPTAGHYHFSFFFQHKSVNTGIAFCYFRKNESGSVTVMALTSAYESTAGSVIYPLAVNDIVSLDCFGFEHMDTTQYNAMLTGFLISHD